MDTDSVSGNIQGVMETAVGLLSTDFESYFEDTDYCLRASQAGFNTVLCGGVTLVPAPL